MDTHCITRRESLRLFGNGLAGLGLSSFLIRCATDTAQRLMEAESKTETAGINKRDREILRLASLAPSGHNTQPWRIEPVKKNRWIIHSDKKSWLPAVDSENRELLLSTGAFLENLITVAALYGRDCAYRVLARDRFDTTILDVTFTDAKPRQYPVSRIESRRTLRSNIGSGDISAEDFNYITTDSIRNFHYIPRETEEGRFLAEATIEANRIQAFRNDAQQELASWIRWRSEDAEKYRNGITPETMEISGIAKWFVKHFYDSSSVMEKGFREKTVEIVKEQVNNCGGWIIATSKDSSIPSLIETGRRFQRMFLMVRERMIAIHPMTQILEEDPFRQQVKNALKCSGEIQFILRTGYVNRYPGPVSLRKPVSKIIISG